MEHSSLPPPSPFPAIGRHQRTPSYTRFDVPVDKQLVQRKSSISQHSILAARRLLSDDESLAASNEMINQFLRATGGDREHAIRRLKDTLKWRQTEGVDRLLCTACLNKDGAHYMQVVGHDSLKRPILYSCLSQPTNRSVEDNRRHMIATFEQAIRTMSSGTEQWVWISDFHGFGLRDTDPRLAKIFLDVSAKHYPERLAVFYCIDAPGLFSMLWRALQPFVDPITREKVRFLPYDVDNKGRKPSSLAADLGQNMEQSMQRWLLKEMAQNRSRKIAKHKVIPYAANFANGDDGAILEGHDCRGEADFVELVKSKPSIMLPAKLLEECKLQGKSVTNAALASIC